MANRIPMRPPEYRGSDPEKRELYDYLEYLYQTLDHQLGEINKTLRILRTVKTEEE